MTFEPPRNRAWISRGFALLSISLLATGAARASGPPHPAAKPANGPGDKTVPVWSDPALASAPCFARQDASSGPDPAVLLALRRRHEELEAWAAGLARKQAAVTEAQHKLARQAAGLQQIRQQVEALQARQEERSSAQRKALTSIYEVMQPHDAAQIFHHLPPVLVVRLLRGMDSRHAAAILAIMPPDDARAATEGLAQAGEMAMPAASVEPAAAKR